MRRNLENQILDAIDIMVNEKLSSLKFNYYIEASIEAINDDGTYEIKFNDQILSKIKAKEGLSLSTNDIVLVCVVNGNFSNKFIDLKRP